jgi:GT2 family glycosyltransferase
LIGKSASVIILAHGAEPYLGECVKSVLDSTGDDIEVVIVDNEARDAVDLLPPCDRLRVYRPARNLGFAAGCNRGVLESSGDDLIFLNSDAVVQQGAIAALRAELRDSWTGLASGSVRLATEPEIINSAGNPVHFLGFAWAGGYGEPATDHSEPAGVTSVSGAFFAVRRSVWDALGGFLDEYFAYHEDTELSLRAWQRGYRACYVPHAVALHHYEFSRNPRKHYLLERNRLLTVLTVYPSTVLALVLPALLALELAMCLVALRQRWLTAKLSGWWWLLTHHRLLLRRRREVQPASTLTAHEFARLLAASIVVPESERPPGLGAVNYVLSRYWRCVLKFLAWRA